MSKPTIEFFDDSIIEHGTHKCIDDTVASLLTVGSQFEIGEILLTKKELQHMLKEIEEMEQKLFPRDLYE
jgi:hypothetical protein